MRRITIRSGVLLLVAGLCSGQLGPCGAAAPVGGGGGSVVGVWRATYNDPLVGPATIELVLQPDGNFSKQTASAVSLVTITGPYFVDFPEPAMLRLTIFHGEPSEFCGPLGCTQIQYPAGETYTYTLIDANTLQLRDFYCVEGQGVECTLTYARAG